MRKLRSERATTAAVEFHTASGYILSQFWRWAIVPVSWSPLTTRWGAFRMVVFEPDADGAQHIALTRGHIRGAAAVPVRIHSECLAGDVFGATRCDTGAQLDRALDGLAARPNGILVYLRQEGRGIGLTQAVTSYRLQHMKGLDTVDANTALGEASDQRCYAVAADMLRALGPQSIELWTSNLDKFHQLQWAGIDVVRRVPFGVSHVSDAASTMTDTLRERCGYAAGDGC